MPFPFVLLLAFALPQTASNPSKPDALALLNEVSQRYADAKSYHIEAVEEENSSNELQYSWQKSLLTAIVMPGGRYRYEGRSGYAAALLVSDGTTQWDYHFYEHIYTQQPVSPQLKSKRRFSQQEMAADKANYIVDQMARRARHLKSATFLPDETISVDGKSVECYVVRYSGEDLKTKKNDLKEDVTLWIEKSRKVVRKTLSQLDSSLVTDVSSHLPFHGETTVTYPAVELDQPEPASSFTFVAPSDAKLIPEFPDPFAERSQIEAMDSVAKPAPELQLKSAEGKITTLSSFRGRPVFIEFWATWCGPCVGLMPELTRLYQETANRGLAWMSVDNDEDSALRAAIAKLGPQFSAVASAGGSSK
jgi:thiol-disulfide isomerase/thioredoxin